MSNNNNPDREAEEAGPVPVPVPPDNEPEAPGGVAPPPRPVVAAAAAAVVEDNDDDKIRTNTVPPEVIKLWKEVGKGLEFNQTGEYFSSSSLWYIHDFGRHTGFGFGAA